MYCKKNLSIDYLKQTSVKINEVIAEIAILEASIGFGLSTKFSVTQPFSSSAHSGPGQFMTPSLTYAFEMQLREVSLQLM